MNKSLKQFQNAIPLKTAGAAQRRLDRWTESNRKLVDGSRTTLPLLLVLGVEGGYLPVAVVGAQSSVFTISLAESGICVTNVL